MRLIFFQPYVEQKQSHMVRLDFPEIELAASGHRSIYVVDLWNYTVDEITVLSMWTHSVFTYAVVSIRIYQSLIEDRFPTYSNQHRDVPDADGR